MPAIGASCIGPCLSCLCPRWLLLESQPLHLPNLPLQGFSSIRAAAGSICCAVSFALFSWLPALLRWCGLPAYTEQMRAQLRVISSEVYAIVLAPILIKFLPLPAAAAAAAAAPATKTVAAIGAAVALMKAAAAAVQAWNKDDLPQRRADVKELAKKRAAARRMAPAGAEGSLADLARAVVREPERTQARATAALSVIRGSRSRSRCWSRSRSRRQSRCDCAGGAHSCGRLRTEQSPSCSAADGTNEHRAASAGTGWRWRCCIQPQRCGIKRKRWRRGAE